MQVILLTHSIKKKAWKYAITKLKIASWSEEMIHTAKDAQDTAATSSLAKTFSESNEGKSHWTWLFSGILVPTGRLQNPLSSQTELCSRGKKQLAL